MRKVIKLVLLLSLFFILKKQVWGLMGPVFEVKEGKGENRPVFAGDVWRQSFVSPEEEFGAVGIKVSNNNRLNDDFWVFRIKKEEEKDWYFETRKYITDFQEEIFYPFGFPKITGAKGEKFVFEIESEKGKEDNSASVFFSSKDIYAKGEAYYNNNQTKGDLLFAVYKETPAEKLIVNDFLTKIKQDHNFFLFYFLSLFTLVSFFRRV